MKAAIYDSLGVIRQMVVGSEDSIASMCSFTGMYYIEVFGPENDATHKVVNGKVVPIQTS